MFKLTTLAAVLLAFIPSTVSAQTITGELYIQDKTGAISPYVGEVYLFPAIVRVKGDTDKDFKRALKAVGAAVHHTSKPGQYAFHNIPAGSYTLAVRSSGKFHNASIMFIGDKKKPIEVYYHIVVPALAGAKIIYNLDERPRLDKSKTPTVQPKPKE